MYIYSYTSIYSINIYIIYIHIQKPMTFLWKSSWPIWPEEKKGVPLYGKRFPLNVQGSDRPVVDTGSPSALVDSHLIIEGMGSFPSIWNHVATWKTHPPSLTARPWKMMVGRRSFPFGMVNFQGVGLLVVKSLWNPRKCHSQVLGFVWSFKTWLTIDFETLGVCDLNELSLSRLHWVLWRWFVFNGL